MTPPLPNPKGGRRFKEAAKAQQCPRGPRPRNQPGRGLLSFGEAMHELRCQVPREGPHSRSDAVCGRRISAAHRPVQPTGRILSDLSERETGKLAGWCYRCGKASEYEVVEADREVA